MSRIGYGSAPGKVIISGDHSVVYKYPALASAIDLRCRVKAVEINSGLRIIANDFGISVDYTADELSRVGEGKDVHDKFDGIARIVNSMIDKGIQLEIESEVPISAGLGSSAAVAVATVAAIADLYEMDISRERISELAFESEKVIHGRPSGIDNSIATYGGLLVFNDGKIDLKELKYEIPLVIVNSKVPRDTKKLVASVADLREEIDEIDKVLYSMGNITRNVIDTVENGDLRRLGKLLDINQGLLDAIGVGHSALSEIIWRLRGIGLLGAKLTGAGGGGCMIGLMENSDNNEKIIAELSTLDVDVIFTSASSRGVEIGK